MPSVFLCSPTNSQLFTTCCEVAIGTERTCPKCRQVITPETEKDRWMSAYNPIERGQRPYGNWLGFEARLLSTATGKEKT